MSNIKDTFSLSSVKPFKGHEGEPLIQGKLKQNNKVVADWSEDNRGGCMNWRFTVKDADKAFAEWAKTYLLDKKCLGKPYDIASMSAWQLQEAALEEMAEEVHELREAKRLTKNGVLALKATPKNAENPLKAIPQCYQFKELRYCDAHMAKALKEIKSTLPAEVELVWLNEWVGQEKVTDEQGENMRIDAWLKPKCKTKTVASWRATPESAIEYKTFNQAYSANIAKQIRDTYKEKVVEIINERYLGQ